ncbi:MAG: cytochrome P450 [Acidimicrobiia bacterium]|nr:cytochrome P450 [Acidimicrobiia bacterium]
MSRGRQSIPEIEALLADPGFQADPHAAFHILRRRAPVYWSESRNHWLVTSMDLVGEVLGNPTDFSSVGFESRKIGRLSDEVASASATVRDHFATNQLVSSDPPDHTRIRRAFGSQFLPRKVMPLGRMIRAAAERLLDAIDPDRPDVVPDLAEPLPVEVISEIIGIPQHARDRIPVVTLDQREFFGAPSLNVDHARRFSSTLTEWNGLLSTWMDERRSSPGDDILTRAAEVVDDGRVSHDEAVATVLHLVIAGNGTTTALISNAVYHILRHPDQARLLASEPDRIPNAVEEALRFEAPLPTDRRIATRTRALGDETILEGDLVMAGLAAANRDPEHFDAPDEFDVTRTFTESHHVAFGRGIHLCLGAPVARLEAAVALEVLFERFGVAALPDGFEPNWHAITTHRGLRTLPILPERRP